MAYSVGNPIVFKSGEEGGDSVSVAFSKHIQEITRIYGILNELARADISANDLEELKSGNISGERVIGTIAGNILGSHIKGAVDASQVSGPLTWCTMEAGNVNGLSQFINGVIDGRVDINISESAFSSRVGYIKLSNGLIAQWGNSGNIFQGANIGGMTFPFTFNSGCYMLQVTYKDTDINGNTWCSVVSCTKNSFFCIRGRGSSGSSVVDEGVIRPAEYIEDISDTGSVDFFAIGA